MTPKIIPFTDSLLSQAGALLHHRHQQMPGEGFSLARAPEAQAAVAAAWGRAGASGVVAVEQGQVVGYLIGDPVVNEHWGRSAWVRLAGYSLAAGQDPELFRDLYAALAERWVRDGCFNHFVLARAEDLEALGIWFSTSFGIEQVYGLRSLESLPPHWGEAPPGLSIRRADAGDRAAMEELSSLIWRHQVQAPVWGIHLPEDTPLQRQSWGDLPEDPEAVVWLAFLDGKPAGVQVYFPQPQDPGDPMAPEACIELSVAATVEEARGRGVGTALTRHGLEQARASGYRYCSADWRSTNLLSSRFWPWQGFLPMTYRLVRRVDPRIAWAGEYQ